MTELPRFLVRHALIGFCIAILFIAALLVFDIGGFRALAGASPTGRLAVVMLALSTGATFASLQMGFAIMLLGTDDRDSGAGRRSLARIIRSRHHAIPIPAPATRRRRRRRT